MTGKSALEKLRCHSAGGVKTNFLFNHLHNLRQRDQKLCSNLFTFRDSGLHFILWLLYI